MPVELGYTDLGPYNPIILDPITETVITERKVILLASNNIHDTNIFLNGLSPLAP